MIQTKDQETIWVVDADSHISEPHDLWTSRVSPNHRALVPHVVRGNDGLDTWLINGDTEFSPGGASSAIRPDGSKQPLTEFDIRTGLQQDQVHPASWDVKARLQLLDELGIWAQIVYPNVVGFGANKLVHIDKALSAEIVSIYNDAMAELQEESGERLFPQALVPFWDIDGAVSEVQRAKELGLAASSCAANHTWVAFRTCWTPIGTRCGRRPEISECRSTSTWVRVTSPWSPS